MAEVMTNPFLEMLLNEGESQEERNAAAHAYINARDGNIKREVATDLGLWILYGAKDVTVATQIRLSRYKSEREAVLCARA